jgi:NADH:ubiquinone oxidoreductase subunit 2 (subunit N)
MSMIYGATGTLEITGVAERLYGGGANKTMLVFGLVFLVAGLAFKLGVVPFHMWIPDVYHGAPTSVTLLIGTAPKARGLCNSHAPAGQWFDHHGPGLAGDADHPVCAVDGNR